MLIASSTKTYYNIWRNSFLRVAKTSTTNFAFSVTVRESVPGAKSYDQLIWLKLSTEVGCEEISQKSLWLSSLTSSSVVLRGMGGGVSFFFPLTTKNPASKGKFWKCHLNITPLVNCVAKWIWPWTLLWSLQLMPVKKKSRNKWSAPVEIKK